MINFIVGVLYGLAIAFLIRTLGDGEYRRGYEDAMFDAVKRRTIDEAVCKHLDESKHT